MARHRADAGVACAPTQEGRTVPATVSVIFKVSPALLADFDAVCDAAGLSRSAALRQFMRRELDRYNGVVDLFDDQP